MTVRREVEMFEIELIPSSWKPVLERHGMKVRLALKRLQVTSPKGPSLTLIAEPDGSTIRWVYRVNYSWPPQFPPAASVYCHSTPEAAIWLEDFVWLCENWEAKRNESDLPWKELLLSAPVSNERVDTPGPFDMEGYCIRTCYRSINDNYRYRRRSLSREYFSLRCSHRHSRPWSIRRTGPYGNRQTRRFYTMDGAIRSLVRALT